MAEGAGGAGNRAGDASHPNLHLRADPEGGNHQESSGFHSWNARGAEISTGEIPELQEGLRRGRGCTRRCQVLSLEKQPARRREYL